MTAELEDQQEKPNQQDDDKGLGDKIESDDEKIQKIGEEEVEENVKKTDESEAKEADADEDAEEVVVVTTRRRLPQFLGRLFSKRSNKHNEGAEQDPEAGTELLSKEKNSIVVKSEDSKSEKNDNGTDVTIAIGDENGDAPNGKAKDPEVVEKYSPIYWKKVGIGLLVIAVLLTIVTVVTLMVSPAKKARGPMMEPLVITDCGPLKGYLEEGMYVFKGIPYALPPVGEHRWKPPRSASSLEDCWNDTYQAVNDSAICFQKPIQGVDVEMSEDCLYLDVITPSLSPPVPRSVVMYFPGDNPLQGFNSADFKWVLTPSLADEKDVTFVTARYRTGALGFMSVDVLSESVRPPTSGNYGIMDMIAALKWVQKNIRMFGGDPEKVTVFAHGGGATASLALLSSKKAEGLFNQMWLSAPAARFSNKSLDQISEDNNAFLKKLECNNVQCLYNKTAEEIVQATPSFWSSDWSLDLPSSEEEQWPTMTVVDGVVLYDVPYNMWKNGDVNDVSVVFGSSAQESSWSSILPGLDTWTWTDFSDYVSEKLGSISTNLTVEAIEFYIRNDTTPLQQFHSMVSDVRTICPLSRLTEALDEAVDKDVYWYLVDYKPRSPIQFSNESAKTSLSTHGLDVVAIFGLLDVYLGGLELSDVLFQKGMQDLFFSYVQRGSPDIRREILMPSGFINIIGDQIQSRMTPYENCHIWDKEDLYSLYAKLN